MTVKYGPSVKAPPPLSTEMFRRMADALPAMIWLSGTDSHCTWCNQSWLTFTGRTLEQEIGTGWADDIHPLDRSHCLNLYAEAFRARRPFEMEYRLRRHDGEYRWVVDAAAPLYEGDTFLGYAGSCADVDERKHAEEALRLSEERYRSLIEMSPEPIAIIQGGFLVYVNPAGVRAIGCASAAEMLGRKLRDFIHPDDQQRGDERLRTTLETGQPTPLQQFRVRHRDGSWREMESRASPCQYGGKPAIQIVVRDISERQRAEEALRLSEERYRSLVELSPVLIAILQDGCVAYVNPTGAAMLGADSPAQVVGQLTARFIHPDDRRASEERQRLVLESGQRLPFRRFRFLRFDGGHVEVESHGGWCSHQGRPAFLVVARDITEILQGEMALRESEARHRAILESSLDGLIVINALGQILEFNKAAETIFGHSREAVVGKNLAEVIIPPSYREAHCRGLEWYLASGEGPVIGKRIEMPALRADGSEFRVELSIIAVIGAGPLLFAGVVRDITERLKLEEQLRQSQKLHAIGQLAGGIAHDFNNMLTVISGHSDLLLDLIDAAGPMRASVTAIHDAGERAGLLTRQLLMFSRKRILEPKALFLNDMIRNAGMLLRRLIGEDIVLSTVLSASLHRVMADPGQIEQLIMNLSLNSRDAMPQGGTLTIETQDVEIDRDRCQIHPDARPGRYVQLSVTDTGCGLTPEVRAHLFEPFFTTKGPGKGTGLGLATVYGIVQQSGGFITVHSEVGIGTAFHIYVPAVDSEPSSQPVAEPTSIDPRGSETILIVEDEEGVRRIAQLALDMQGYRILEADCAPEAIRLFETHKDKINLLLTDVVMPEMSGRHLAERLRMVRPDLKVLYMSGYNDDDVVRHGILAATDAFLQKPFTPLSLARKVRGVLDGNG